MNTDKTPTLTPASDGFWWLWHEGEWSPVSVETREGDGLQAPSAFLRILKLDGYRSFRIRNPETYTWGGRIAPPEGVE